jgi:hypothetical protein
MIHCRTAPRVGRAYPFPSTGSLRPRAPRCGTSAHPARCGPP